MNIQVSEHRLPDRDRTDDIIRIEAKAIRRDLRLSFAAAVSVILVISGGLLTVSVVIRSGWVSDHEVQMDKAAAIHKLLFRQ